LNTRRIVCGTALSGNIAPSHAFAIQWRAVLKTTQDAAPAETSGLNFELDIQAGTESVAHVLELVRTATLITIRKREQSFVRVVDDAATTILDLQILMRSTCFGS
jgi:hypothetical protein